MELALHLQIVKKTKIYTFLGTNCHSIKPDRNWALSQTIFCLTSIAKYYKNIFFAMIT